MAKDLTAASFAEHEGSTFTVHVGEETVDLELIDVTEHDYSEQESFSVLFRGSAEHVFNHGLYRVEHSELGAYDLFIGPVITGQDTDDDTQHFESAFSRKVSV